VRFGAVESLVDWGCDVWCCVGAAEHKLLLAIHDASSRGTGTSWVQASWVRDSVVRGLDALDTLSCCSSKTAFGRTD
jgi:hypothetical protein